MAIFIFVGVLSFQTMVQNGEDRAWVTHTHLVIEKLDTVLANLLDAETGQRGYILAGEQSELEPYNEALAHVHQNVSDLRALTADNATQQRALDRLEPFIAKMLATLQERIAIRDRDGLDAAAEEVRKGAAELHMQEIRAGIGGMRQEENRLMLIRTEHSEASSRKTTVMIVTAGCLAVVFLGLAAVFLGQRLEQRQRSEEIRRLNIDLERRVSERTAQLSERAKELERSNADLQQFAYVASHDLQEPLRMVASFTQLLAKRYGDKLDNDAREFIDYAVDGATRMQTLISDLLDYSRVGAQGNSLKRTECQDLFDRVLLSLKIIIEESKAVITHDPLPVVLADPLQLGQLFQNLLANAIKFKSEAPPRIKISVEESGSDWKFSFYDNGIGIAPEHADRIFIIFQRLHSRTEYPGTGIGLAICKKIVERHGGRIWVEPSPEGGSAFCFTIPAVPVQTQEEREQNELRIPVTAH